MRIVIIGTSAAALATAHVLIKHKHDVVVIEQKKERIDELAEELDCGFLHGDGTRPKLLREAGPADTDVLLCLTKNDQDNILASLVGRSLGFGEVVTKVSDPELGHICAELGLHNTINADEVTARRLVDMIEGRGVVELSTVLRGDTRFFVISVRADEAGPLDGLRLPAETRVLYGYRKGKLLLPNGDTPLVAGDDLVLLTHARRIPELQDRGKQKDG
jgi:trk system potassium uptake protein TrkA